MTDEENFEILVRDEPMIIDLTNPDLGSFLGAFISEGNLSGLSLKISNDSLKFLNYITDCAKAVFGAKAASQLPPTPEHKDGRCNSFHKYYSSLVCKVLKDGYGVKEGKRILNDQGLPPIILSLLNQPEMNDLRAWLVRYLQSRFSGDGHVRNGINIGKDGCKIVSRGIYLTKNKVLNVDKEMLQEVEKHYERGKKINSYPRELILALKAKVRDESNYPKEFVDIKNILEKVFHISSRFEKELSKVYKDKKRQAIVVTGKYRIVISRKGDIEKFAKEINFAPPDDLNRKRLENVITSFN